MPAALFQYECTNLILDGAVCRGVRAANGKEEMEITCGHTVIATGRRGADWLESLCAQHNIAHQPGTVDIGVRGGGRNEVMEKASSFCHVRLPSRISPKRWTMMCPAPSMLVSSPTFWA